MNVIDKGNLDKVTILKTTTGYHISEYKLDKIKLKKIIGKNWSPYRAVEHIYLICC